MYIKDVHVGDVCTCVCIYIRVCALSAEPGCRYMYTLCVYMSMYMYKVCTNYMYMYL